MVDSWDLSREKERFNPYRIDLWSPEDKHLRLIAVSFDLQTGRAAFAGAVRTFRGARITLRERARVICTTERDEDRDEALAWVERYLFPREDAGAA
ncbi:hypothetical protein [Enterovirga rhinocerotis]|uniref:Uncharacterized protein n=1 Tax=Enterovirga rhinocerotis TaxID=1339210 RepID=A0A4R7CAX0_9HYPH|nr:hypothetical protein [Enterovirga rhinocerotis]TDR94186.1 hypothetical protein EV668_1464 [Enterovirga rhinocerotis]